MPLCIFDRASPLLCVFVWLPRCLRHTISPGYLRLSCQIDGAPSTTPNKQQHTFTHRKTRPQNQAALNHSLTRDYEKPVVTPARAEGDPNNTRKSRYGTSLEAPSRIALRRYWDAALLPLISCVTVTDPRKKRPRFRTLDLLVAKRHTTRRETAEENLRTVETHGDRLT